MYASVFGFFRSLEWFWDASSWLRVSLPCSFLLLIYGHSTFWLSSHLLKDISVVRYPHFKDEQTKAKKGNLVESHTASKWQHQDLEGSCAHHSLLTQHSSAPDFECRSWLQSPCSWPLSCNNGTTLHCAGISSHRLVVSMSVPRCVR